VFGGVAPTVAFAAVAAANDCLGDGEGCRAAFDRGEGLERKPGAVGREVLKTYFPHLAPYQPFGPPPAKPDGTPRRAKS